MDMDEREMFRRKLSQPNLTEFEMDQIFLGEKSLEEHVFVDDD